jgi:serine/threonine-protein kinase RsbW
MNTIKIHAESPPEYGTMLFKRQIASELSLKNSLIDEILATLQTKGFLDKEDEVWARLCLDEGLINAIKHGNKEDKNKKVQISLFIAEKMWSIRIEDEGEGFPEQFLPDLDKKSYLELEHGRGILLMKSYMDEIWYYDKGKRVQLTKRKKSGLRKILDKVLIFFKIK